MGRNSHRVEAYGFSHLTAEMWPALAVTSLRGGRRKRASRTNFENRTANSRIRLACRFSIDSIGINCVPTPMAVAPAKTNASAFCWLTPPEAISETCGSERLSARTYPSHPLEPQEKLLRN